MAIHVPGIRDRRNRETGGNRDVVAVLSLTAMVDLFTVLVVFLLQNYATTGQVIQIPHNVKLPTASDVKKLTPANVVIISSTGIQVNNDPPVMKLSTAREQPNWDLAPLRVALQQLVAKGKEQKSEIGSQIQSAVARIQGGAQAQAQKIPSYLKLTIQADKHMDFLTLKKVMYTATEAGIVQINFAVIKKGKKTGA